MRGLEKSVVRSDVPAPHPPSTSPRALAPPKKDISCVSLHTHAIHLSPYCRPPPKKVMQRALTYYRAHRISEQDVSPSASGKWKVYLGSGRAELPSDLRVAHICHCLLRHYCPLPVSKICEYVNGDDFELDATGGTFPQREPHDPLPSRFLRKGTVHRAALRMWSVGVRLLQKYADEPEHFSDASNDFGWEASQTRTFSTVDRAKLALAIQRHHNALGPQLILQLLRASTHSPGGARWMELDFGELEVSKPDDASEMVPAVSTSRWEGLLHYVLKPRGYCEQLKVYSEQYSHFLIMTFVDAHWTVVHAHWCEHNLSEHNLSAGAITVLFHRSLVDWRLTFEPGNCVRLVAPSLPHLDRHPWWVSETLERAPRSFLDNSRTGCGDARRPEKRSLDVADTLCAAIKKEKVILERWARSHKLLETKALLVQLIQCRAYTPDVNSYEDCVLHRCTRDEFATPDGAQSVFAEAFGTHYGASIPQRMDAIGQNFFCFVSRTGAEAPVVGAVTGLLFQCVLADGTDSFALLIDSIAVRRGLHGRGHGARLLAACRDVVHDALGDRCCPYVIFAQCVLKSPGADFWLDKLDDSSEARSLMLQARMLLKDAISVYDNCRPRARLYRRTPIAK